MNMTRFITTAMVLTVLSASAAQAACYADYKAKRDDPLKLHYGVIELSSGACDSKSAASREVSAKIGRDGWKLLTVTGIFDESGLQKRKSRAGAYYLRY